MRAVSLVICGAELPLLSRSEQGPGPWEKSFLPRSLLQVTLWWVQFGACPEGDPRVASQTGPARGCSFLEKAEEPGHFPPVEVAGRSFLLRPAGCMPHS